MIFARKQFFVFFKLFFFFTIFIVLFYVLEYGFAFDSWYKLITPFLLSGMTVVMLVKKSLRYYIFSLSIICLTVMILVYLFNMLDFSKIVGNFGFSLLIITIILYIPQIIKDGYIERF